MAAMLPRLHGRSEPGPELDAAILSAAQAATHASRGDPRPPHRRSWIAPTALAASLMLAIGVAWQLRPLPGMQAPATESEAGAASADSGVSSMRAIDAPPTERDGFAAQPKPMAVPPPPAEPATPQPARVAKAARRVQPVADAESPAIAAPPPPPAPVVMDTPRAVDVAPAPAQAAEAARAPAPPVAKSVQAGTVVRQQASAAGNAGAREKDEAAMAADANTLHSITIVDAEASDEDVPPATADAPEVRTAWLRRIGELQREGKTAEARASLEEFRHRYPDAVIPTELRQLED